jgi:broad specificity phosphatase PhoE
MASLYLIRHGQASFGADDYDALSEVGVRQCRLLGEWWRAREWKIGRVIAGPMRRHRQSVEAFIEGLQRPLNSITLPALAEFNHEDVLAVYRPEFRDKSAIARVVMQAPQPRETFRQIFAAAVQRWHDGRFDAEYKESWPVFRQRIVAGFDELRAGNEDALVFTSGGAISVMLQAVLELADKHCFALNAVIRNGSVTRVLYRPGETSLHTFNDTAHLDIHADASLLTYR